MAAGKTYKLISSTTLGSAASSVTFSSIPATYTDLILISVATNTNSNGTGLGIRFNSDTATNYSKLYLYGDGTSAVSGRNANQTSISISNMDVTTAEFGTAVTHIQNYSNSTTYKTLLSRGGATTSGNLVIFYTGTWRSTAAISTITLLPDAGNLNANSTFTLYGITAA